MINKVIIIGNLGGDPELRTTTNGTQVATLSVATTERWRGQDGQLQEQTEWHRVVVWDKLADICGRYLRKGSRVYIEGKLQTRKWQDQNGQDRYTTEIVAREMKMLGDARREDAGNGPETGYNQRTGGDASAGIPGGQSSNSGPYRPPQQQSFMPPQNGAQRPHNPPGYNEDDVPF